MNGQDIQIKFNELLDLTRQSFETFLQHTESAIKEGRPLMLAVLEDEADPEKLALDLALLKAAPTVAVPRHCEFAPLRENGHRFLMAEDGLYLEVRRPWLHFIRRLAEQCTVRMPYGPVEEKVQLAFGGVGSALAQMKEFGAYAQAESPIEAAASLVWHEGRGDWQIRYPETIGEATPSRIQYKQVDVDAGAGESLVIDLHSHGCGRAYFSEQDDADDAGAVKIAGVFGNLDTATPMVDFRLCVLGLYLPMRVPADKIFG